MPDLIAQLRAAPQDFNLFQAISLVERSEPARSPVGCGVGANEALRLAAQVDMAFAPSDIASLGESARPGPPLTLRTAALTLAGAQGPLAAPFTELLLARRRARDGAGLDFLDIFNQRLIGFWYRARCKHHLALQGIAARAPLPRSLDALSGLGLAEGALGPGGELAWLRHAGLQGSAPRSLATLLTLLRDRLGVAFEGRQFVGHWHPLADCDRARLRGLGGGQAAQRLGGGASLGARAWDQAAGIALRAPSLTPDRFAALLPDGRQCGLLGWLVARHLQRDVKVTLELKLAGRPESRLGAQHGGGLAPRLGRSAWLCGRAAPSGPGCEYRAVRFVLPGQGS
ncbi:type VI secretion system baseplate subunit TssG [Pseudoduganella sp. R-32]|uniref:type VI secretion system baseplate subunit TssG n=1 Tax=Pseudoduganella sp. R-32 TaxID=3404061 RepID=UPI003CF00DB3